MTPKEIEEIVEILVEGNTTGNYRGVDNYKNPKRDYLRKIVIMDDTQLFEECKDKIWLSAYANNNPRSDYHWHVDACYDECKRRKKIDIYSKAWKYASGNT